MSRTHRHTKYANIDPAIPTPVTARTRFVSHTGSRIFHKGMTFARFTLYQWSCVKSLTVSLRLQLHIHFVLSILSPHTSQEEGHPWITTKNIIFSWKSALMIQNATNIIMNIDTKNVWAMVRNQRATVTVEGKSNVSSPSCYHKTSVNLRMTKLWYSLFAGIGAKGNARFKHFTRFIVSKVISFGPNSREASSSSRSMFAENQWS